MLRVGFVPFLVVGLLALGCGDDDNDVPPDAETDAPVPADTGVPPVDAGPDAALDTAAIRVIHLSPDAPAVDVFANGATPAVVTDLEFPEGTEYLSVPAGTYDFDVAPEGGEPADAVLSVADLELEAGNNYTAVAYDVLASIQALALEDDMSPVAAGNIRLRVIHVAVGVGEVDIWNVTDPGDPQPLYTDVDFGDVTDYAELPAEAYTVGIDVDGDADPDLIFEVPALDDGEVVNVFAVAEGEDVFLIAQLSDGTTVRIDPVEEA
jgi:hypothetical protein